MKKTLYTILAVGTIFFTASCGEDRGTTTEVTSANEDERVNPKHLRGYGDREPGGVDSINQKGGQMYSFDTDRLTTEMATDMQLNNDLATEIVKVYYDRDRQLSEMMQRYQLSDTARMGGDAASMKKMEEMKKEHERINLETDKKVKGKLTPEQYKMYEKNRSKYHKSTSGKHSHM
jgi:hypothetical protein